MRLFGALSWAWTCSSCSTVLFGTGGVGFERVWDFLSSPEAYPKAWGTRPLIWAFLWTFLCPHPSSVAKVMLVWLGQCIKCWSSPHTRSWSFKLLCPLQVISRAWKFVRELKTCIPWLGLVGGPTDLVCAESGASKTAASDHFSQKHQITPPRSFFNIPTMGGWRYCYSRGMTKVSGRLTKYWGLREQVSFGTWFSLALKLSKPNQSKPTKPNLILNLNLEANQPNHPAQPEP